MQFITSFVRRKIVTLWLLADFDSIIYIPTINSGSKTPKSTFSELPRREESIHTRNLFYRSEESQMTCHFSTNALVGNSCKKCGSTPKGL